MRACHWRRAGYKSRTMNTRILKAVCLLTAGAILASASIGTARAQLPFVPSLPFNRSSTAEKVVTAAVIAMTIYFIARYEATEHQREVAEIRGGQTYAPRAGQGRAGLKRREGAFVAVGT